jgi:RNA polymerase sigma factor (sigma-70 family)
VHKWARRYYRYAQSIPTVSYEDIFLEGVYGLIKAIDKYKPQKGSFSTYATIWIKQSIRRFLQKEKAQLKGRGYLPVQEDEEEQMTLEDMPAEEEELPSSDLENLKRKIEYAPIPQRSKDILRMYFLEGYSLREIGEKIGLSKERVRQLIKEDGKKVLEE